MWSAVRSANVVCLHSHPFKRKIRLLFNEIGEVGEKWYSRNFKKKDPYI